jgi:hypothetical protein
MKKSLLSYLDPCSWSYKVKDIAGTIIEIGGLMGICRTYAEISKGVGQAEDPILEAITKTVTMTVSVGIYLFGRTITESALKNEVRKEIESKYELKPKTED